jgi:hypothetical protein
MGTIKPMFDIPSMAYLAIAYTGKYGKKCPRYRKELSFQMANAVAARLMEGGELIYSPISHSHPIHDYMVHYAHDHNFWMQYDDEMMEFCNRLYVIKTKDWESSDGVRREIEWFLRRGRPLFFIELDSETGQVYKEEFVKQKVNGVHVEQLILPLDK